MKLTTITDNLHTVLLKNYKTHHIFGFMPTVLLKNYKLRGMVYIMNIGILHTAICLDGGDS